MHVVIVGCGRVGSTLALSLISSGHSVAVVDRKSDAFFRLRDNFAGQTITGIGFDRDVLELAGIKKASAVAAVTNGDNSNILVARVARESFGIENVVARISDPKRAEIYERLGISTIATVKWTADRILRRILPDLPAIEWTDPSSSVVLIERALPDSLVGEKVLELEIKGARISALRRLGTAVIPDSKTLVQQSDIAYFTVEKDSVNSLDEFLKRGKS
ncbi:MAG: potassium channel family protein [Acidimicrobiaceae bacterium]